jgi:hypothetical protein
LYIHMGEEIHHLKVIPMMSIISGDAKSADNLCCHYMTWNCNGRVPQLCMTLLWKSWQSHAGMQVG